MKFITKQNKIVQITILRLLNKTLIALQIENTTKIKENKSMNCNMYLYNQSLL